MRSNKEEGIISMPGDMRDVLAKLERTNYLDLTHVPMGFRRRLSLLASRDSNFSIVRTTAVKVKRRIKIVHADSKRVLIQIEKK